jgi:hypothetical protein
LIFPDETRFESTKRLNPDCSQTIPAKIAASLDQLVGNSPRNNEGNHDVVARQNEIEVVSVRVLASQGQGQFALHWLTVLEQIYSLSVRHFVQIARNHKVIFLETANQIVQFLNFDAALTLVNVPVVAVGFGLVG